MPEVKKNWIIIKVQKVEKQVFFRKDKMDYQFTAVLQQWRLINAWKLWLLIPFLIAIKPHCAHKNSLEQHCATHYEAESSVLQQNWWEKRQLNVE